jgi:Ni/Fe-hydrogenase subunit HybB-like protein
MPTMKVRHRNPWTIIFWILVTAGAISTIYRFTRGLGAATNLHDLFPWGLWIGFDVLCGVALAAGGFVVAAAVYIFNLEQYKPILRPAILTAFLGYLLVIVALLFDLGRPLNIWYPLVMWNPRSVMFEVGWCVMLYTTVLALEFSPMVVERLNLQRPKRILHAMTIPLVIAGVILSSLHQSSLGSLYLIVPSKLHPLWYSPTLPYLFFLSAIAVGPAMVTIESYYSSRAFRREIELPILSRLGKVSAAALAVYFVLKVEDIINLKLSPYLFAWSFETTMFWTEIIVGVIVPIVLLTNQNIRSQKTGLFISSLFVVAGVLLNRLNISITAIEQYATVRYFPSWMEISVTLMIVASGFAAFRYTAKHLPVFPPEVQQQNIAAVAPTTDVVAIVDLPTSVRN